MRKAIGVIGEWTRSTSNDGLAARRGTWLIYGEDPNADAGGAHYEPFLGVVTGTFTDVIGYARELKDWSTWGAEGRLVLVETRSVTSMDIMARRRLTDRQKSLRTELEEIELKLRE